ncbi:MAG: quinone oxidoreductase family protein [Rectinemataceae bacterium]
MTFPFSFNALAIEQPGAAVSLLKKIITSLDKDEVLIRVDYASINKMDPMMARMNRFQLPAPYVLGFDFGGEVVEVGSEGGLEVGDQVFGNTGAGGCFAEYLVAKKERVLLRGAVPAREASTFGIAFLTVYESLVITGDIGRHQGKTIYVAGAAGGVGHFAVQIAKLHGLKVIGSAGKAASLDLLGRLHVDHIVDYSRQDVVREIMNLTGGQGADLVYDSTYSQASYNVSAAVVASGGEYIRLGTPMQLTAFGIEDMTSVVEGRGANIVITDCGRYSTDPVYIAQMYKLVAGMKQAVAWYEEGKLKPVVTQIVPFAPEPLQEAFEAFLGGINNVGKIVVRCGRQE